jgi:putative nucleotidyltransferase with HDIG domain
VATVAAYLAQARGYSQAEVKLMRVAGLFHDIGKLAIPNTILEKPGKLTEREFAIIKQHPYYTYRILEKIDGFQMIAEWAALHHETLDGAGYPFRVADNSLQLGSRIVAVADVFTALSENRPYRQTLDLKEIEKIMRGMVGNRKLDGAVVSDLFLNSTELYTIMQQRAAAYAAV